MGIKIDGNTPNDIVWKNGNTTYTVAAVQFDGNWVYGRSGTYYLGTLPTGVASLTATYTRSPYEPFDGNRNPLGDGSTVYHGGTLHLTATPSSYYTVTYTQPITVDFKSTRAITATTASQLSASRSKRTVSYTQSDGVTSTTISYVGSSGTSTTADKSVTLSASTTSIAADVWQGGAISWITTAPSYWVSTTGSIAAGSSAASIIAAGTRKMRKANISIGEHINGITFTYTDAAGGPQTLTTSSSTSANFWCGATATWAATVVVAEDALEVALEIPVATVVTGITSATSSASTSYATVVTGISSATSTASSSTTTVATGISSATSSASSATTTVASSSHTHSLS